MKNLAATTLVLAATAVLAACGYPGPPKPPSLNLPRPVSDLRAIRKGNHVYLSWRVPTETTDSLTIREPGPTEICRGTAPTLQDCSGKIARLVTLAPALGNKTAAAAQQTFVDSLSPTLLGDNPSARILYAVSVLNARGRTAGISNVADAPALAASNPPADFSAEVTAGGVVLHWTPVGGGASLPDVKRFYRVYRREAGGTADAIAGEPPLDSAQLIDQTFEWEKTYLYRATVVTEITPPINSPEKPPSQFESDDTPSVKVFAHDVFPPAVPSGLQAAFSGTGQQAFIDLIWSPDTEADLAGYNVYRHDVGGETEKINSEPIKGPAFRDANVVSGRTYVYSVSAVDVRGNESAKSNEAREAAP